MATPALLEARVTAHRRLDGDPLAGVIGGRGCMLPKLARAGADLWRGSFSPLRHALWRACHVVLPFHPQTERCIAVAGSAKPLRQDHTGLGVGSTTRSGSPYYSCFSSTAITFFPCPCHLSQTISSWHLVAQLDLFLVKVSMATLCYLTGRSILNATEPWPSHL
jgi:hypothetical protein